MKTLKTYRPYQIVRLLHCGGLALVLVCTMSVSIQAQVINGKTSYSVIQVQKLIFLTHNGFGEFDWEVEGFVDRFEISGRRYRFWRQASLRSFLMLEKMR